MHFIDPVSCLCSSLCRNPECQPKDADDTEQTNQPLPTGRPIGNSIFTEDQIGGGGGDVGQRSGDTDVLPVNLFDAQPLDQPDLHNGKAQLAHSTLGICAL